MTSQAARARHERTALQKDALWLLRRGEKLTDVFWKARHPGSRLAPTIEKLRNAHGFEILGDGSINSSNEPGRGCPYFLNDTTQMPKLIATTDEIKQNYYETWHWKNVRHKRLEFDSFVCVLCGEEQDLQVHHIVYHLFNEQNSELMTVCRDCHETIHESSRLKFPSGVSVEHVKQIGITPVFESWVVEGAYKQSSYFQTELF